MAKQLGIDIEKHSSELPENKYKDWEFSTKSTVLESGKVSTELIMTKPKNQRRYMSVASKFLVKGIMKSPKSYTLWF